MKEADNPPTARELAARGIASSQRTTGITCPKCGAAHLRPNGTSVLSSGTRIRNMVCRNPSCVKDDGSRTTFVYTQEPPKLLREVAPQIDSQENGNPHSNIGPLTLKLHTRSA